jgi:hypothetical protein
MSLNMHDQQMLTEILDLCRETRDEQREHGRIMTAHEASIRVLEERTGSHHRRLSKAEKRLLEEATGHRSVALKSGGAWGSIGGFLGGMLSGIVAPWAGKW